MKRLKISIRLSILLTLVLLILLSSGVITLLFYFNSKFSVRLLTEDILHNITNHVMDKSLNYLGFAVKGSALSKLRAAREVLKSKNRDELVRYFHDLLAVNEQFVIASFGDVEGNFVMVKRMPDDSYSTKFVTRSGKRATTVWRHSKPDKWGKLYPNVEESADVAYDPRHRPWYKKSIAEKKITWTDVYIFYSDKKPGISCASPVYDDHGELLGVVSIDIGIAEFSYFLGRLKIGKHGRAFIFNNRNEVIAYPITTEKNIASFVKKYTEDGRTKYKLRSIEEMGNPVIGSSLRVLEKKARYPKKTLYSRLKAMVRSSSKKGIIFSFSHEDEDYLAMYSPFPQQAQRNWSIGVVVPEGDFMEWVEKSNHISLAIAAFFILLAVLCGIFISRMISQPLAQLERQMEKVRRFELNADQGVHSFLTEVDRMANSFTAMKKGLRSFEKYVPADLVRALLKSGREAELGGEKRILTVYFSDVADFTKISEQLPPEELVEKLAEYLDVMSKTIHLHSGTVDKYIGDSIMAFWGAPNVLQQHAVLACRAALKSHAALEELNNRWASPFKMRIGINTGELIVGNMGAHNRLNYTVVGDPANVASRLEGLNKYYGTSIIIGEGTYELVKGEMAARLLDFVAVKGKTQALAIYELISLRDETPEEFIEVFARGVELYRKREWEKALSCFEQVLELRGEDRPARIFIERCRLYRSSPPPPDWKGIHFIREKY